MADTSIRCPNCGIEIPLTEALSGQLREQIESALRREHEMRLARAVEQARTSVSESLTLEIQDLKAQLAQKEQKARTAQEAELTLRKEKARLEERSRELDLEVARKLDEEKQRL